MVSACGLREKEREREVRREHEGEGDLKQFERFM